MKTTGMIPVEFVKSGAHYGYGYIAGEHGAVSTDDFDRLEKAGIVKKADMQKAAPAAATKRETR